MTGTCLFHFTNSKEALYGILTENFKPSFARETIRSIKAGLTNDFAAPMVSFSDVRLSEIRESKFPYGKYGIGMKKEWASKNNLCAVMYAEKNSEYLATYSRSINDLYKYIENIEPNNKQLIAIYSHFLSTIRYIKPYQDDLKRKDGTIKDYCFANEREWRYVIPFENTDLPFLNTASLDAKGKDYWNQKISMFHLDFTPKDIQYLIVPKESDIIDLISAIQRIKGKYSYEDVQKLQSRILTAEQIEKDF